MKKKKIKKYHLVYNVKSKLASFNTKFLFLVFKNRFKNFYNSLYLRNSTDNFNNKFFTKNSTFYNYNLDRENIYALDNFYSRGLDTTFLHNEIFMQRIKFKPGYQRI